MALIIVYFEPTTQVESGFLLFKKLLFYFNLITFLKPELKTYQRYHPLIYICVCVCIRRYAHLPPGTNGPSGHPRFLHLGWVLGGEFCLYYFGATVINEAADNFFVVPTSTVMHAPNHIHIYLYISNAYIYTMHVRVGACACACHQRGRRQLPDVEGARRLEGHPHTHIYIYLAWLCLGKSDGYVKHTSGARRLEDA